MPAKKVLDFRNILTPDSMAAMIATYWVKWKTSRKTWENEKIELRNYLFATDTTKTTNSSLPWKNKTTTPKLCQIRDNLHANYMAALFPHDDWFNWLPMDDDAATIDKARAIKAYIRNKLIQSDFRSEVSKLVLDYIDYGNAFGEVNYVNETHTTPEGEVIPIYSGPKLSRISPLDIVFDISATSFSEAPKIVRSIYTLGQLHVLINSYPEQNVMARNALAKCLEVRSTLRMEQPDSLKNEAYMVDGFGSLLQYFSSGFCEILEFEGDYYDVQADTLYENYRIVVLDRAFVVDASPIKSWLGKSNKEHVGWRNRPDTLLAMGPLDNLVGMQYRVDHLENLKADVFDQIATPVVYQRGHVEDWEWGPGERIFGDTESTVEVLHPDATALNADMQIANLLNLMEEMAGAPKQAMGIRTPGEKTMYEVQSLENASGRMFQNKVQHFEAVLIEKFLNQYLECARRNLDPTELVSIVDPDLGVVEFMQVTPADIAAKGKLVPVGARHFAKQAQIVQNLTNLAGSAIYQDQGVNIHFSGLRMAKMIAEALNFTDPELVSPNIRLYEMAESQRTQNVIATQVASEAGADSQVLSSQLGPNSMEDVPQ